MTNHITALEQARDGLEYLTTGKGRHTTMEEILASINAALSQAVAPVAANGAFDTDRTLGLITSYTLAHVDGRFDEAHAFWAQIRAALAASLPVAVQRLAEEAERFIALIGIQFGARATAQAAIKQIAALAAPQQSEAVGVERDFAMLQFPEMYGLPASPSVAVADEQEAVPGAVWFDGSVSLIQRGREDDFCERRGAKRIYFAAKSSAPTPPVAASGQADTERLDWLERRRVSLIPEFEGPWDVTVYDDEGEPKFSACGNTPRAAIDAARTQPPAGGEQV